mmetsp:Transcript_42535/g.76408  ORF Transcript_42535/g.76408 Transcript_42535/m.76408 type:complete len:468 (+) Transcript_42535:33-1436(+)
MSLMMRSVSLALLTCVVARPVLPVPEFKINLDLDPEERFKEVMVHFRGVLQDLVQREASSTEVKKLYKLVALHRGPENEELAGEIRGMSKYGGVPLEAMQAAQLLYELQTIMVPFENVTWPWGQTSPGTDFSFGCTGIIARDAGDGTVTHARNLDFSFAKWLGNMTYNGIFYKKGQELFTSQMIAGYSNPLTGIRRGGNGYTFEINTRYPPKQSNIKNLMKHLFEEKRTTSGWIKRKVLESIDNFEDAVEALSTKPFASTEFVIMSGTQKGVILARDPDDLYHKETLGPHKNDYILITNFDFWDHDKKEWFDPTSIHFGHSRRVGAERLLNNSVNINSDYLYQTLNDDEVIAKDTIFQMLANVEKDSYKTYLPPCEACSGCVDFGSCLQSSESCCGVRSHFTLSCGMGGGYKCGCLADGACRAANLNTSKGDEDCCSFESHFTLACPGSLRKCGPDPSKTASVINYV